jgi:hypothetical protein
MRLTDHLVLAGEFLLYQDFTAGKPPSLWVDGRASVAQISGASVLPTRWSSMDPSMRAGLLGGILGFLSSLCVWYLGERRKRVTTVNSIASNGAHVDKLRQQD